MGKYGKTPATPDHRDLKFSAVFSSFQLPLPPLRFGYGSVYTDWGMLGNDQYGDCVPAGQAHAVMGWNKLAGHPVTFTTESVLSDYTAIAGFNPNDPSTDVGCDMGVAAAYWKNTGMVDTNGVRHKIGAYVWLTPGDYAQLMQACYLFEFVAIGVNIQQAQEDQFQNGQEWDYVPGSPTVGGHCVIPTGRVSMDNNGLITWGQRQGFTRTFYENQNDEAFVAVTVEELKNGVNKRGLSLAQLNADLGAL